MKYLRKNWYYLGLAVGLIAIAWTIWGGLTKIQTILLLNFIALLVHQFEEFGWPGGSPWIINQVMNPDGIPDRYPVNQNNGFMMNVVFGYAFHLLPVFFPNYIWLALAPIMVGFGQFITHGIMINRKLKSIYNPGLFAVVFGHIPLGIWYIMEVYAQNLITVWDWLFGFVWLAVFTALFMKKIGYGLLQDKNSPYPFTPEEMSRYNHSERLTHIVKN